MTFREILKIEIGNQWDNQYYPLPCGKCPLQNTKYCGYEKVAADLYPVCYEMENENKLDMTTDHYIQDMQKEELKRLYAYITKTSQLIEWSPYYLPAWKEGVVRAVARVKELEEILQINEDNNDE